MWRKCAKSRRQFPLAQSIVRGRMGRPNVGMKHLNKHLKNHLKMFVHRGNAKLVARQQLQFGEFLFQAVRLPAVVEHRERAPVIKGVVMVNAIYLE